MHRSFFCKELTTGCFPATCAEWISVAYARKKAIKPTKNFKISASKPGKLVSHILTYDMHKTRLHSASPCCPDHSSQFPQIIFEIATRFISPTTINYSRGFSRDIWVYPSKLLENEASSSPPSPSSVTVYRNSARPSHRKVKCSWQWKDSQRKREGENEEALQSYVRSFRNHHIE